jgi:hypothetical protein
MDVAEAILDKMGSKGAAPSADDPDLADVILDRMGKDKGDEDDTDGVSAAAESAMGDFADALKSGDKASALAALRELLPLLGE